MSSSSIDAPISHDGYIVTLNTFAKFFSDTRKDINDYFDATSELKKKEISKSYLAFGDFDYVSFNGVDRFPRYYDLDDKSKYWLGKHQNVFLYRIKESNTEYELYHYNRAEQNVENKDHGFYVKHKNTEFYYSSLTGQGGKDYTGKEAVFPFFMLTQVSISNEVITRVKDYSQFLVEIKQKLSKKLGKIIASKGFNVYFDIYGCMNSSEIAILWLCQQYSDVLNLIDCLKEFKYKDSDSSKDYLFFSFYSVISRSITNILDSEALSKVENCLKDCKGWARISITVGDKYSATTLHNKLVEKFGKNGVEIKHSTILGGEYDLKVITKTKNIYFSFKKNGNENIGIFRDPEVLDMILGIQIDLTAENESITIEDKLKCINIGDCLLRKKRVKQFNKLATELNPNKKTECVPEDVDYNQLPLITLYACIRKKLGLMFNSHTGSVDTLDMLYADYLSNIHDTYNALWRNDYHYQFKKSLIYILKLFTLDEKDLKEVFWEKFTDTIDHIRQQTVHFSQSGKLVMQIPASHLRYTASADRLFHSYYGMAKAILEDSYLKQNAIKNKIKYKKACPIQSELLPIITTNSTPMIMSTLYHVGVACNDLRILQIDIPYTLLFDPITGFPYLVHELFHYIAPGKRSDRNEAILRMLVNETIAHAYYDQIKDELKEYLFELYQSNSDRFKGLNLNIEGILESKNSKDFTDKFEQFMRMGGGNASCSLDNSRTLKTSIAIAMWKNEKIRSIEEEIVKQTLASYDKDPEEMTWSILTEQFKNSINSITISQMNRISELIVEWMSFCETSIRDDSFYSRVIFDNTLIGCTVKLEDELNKIIYKNKTKLFNPYLIGPIWNNKTVSAAVEDIFMKGLKEALPDYAMVHCCAMTDIDYLVSYARFTHDNGYDTIADYDAIRLTSVLLWYYGKPLNKSQENTIFEFEKNGRKFVESFVSEYMPHSYKIKRITEIFITAIEWHRKLVTVADDFYREYAQYEECLNQIKESYSYCFDLNYSHELKKLAAIARKRREIKVQIRKKLVTEDQWVVVEKYLDKKLFPEFSDNDKETFKSEFCSKAAKNEDNHFEIESSRYDRETFDLILDFIHISSLQKSLEKVGRYVDSKESKEITADRALLKSNHAKTIKTEETAMYSVSLSDLIEQHTVYRAWSLSDFYSKTVKISNDLKNDNCERTWYLVTASEQKILPKGLEKSVNSRKRKCIIGRVSNAVSKLPLSEEDNIAEVLAKSTDENPEFMSNLISWKESLFSAIKSFNTLHTEEVIKDNELLVFCPEKYMKTVNKLKNTQDLPWAKTDECVLIPQRGGAPEWLAEYVFNNKSNEVLEIDKYESSIKKSFRFQKSNIKRYYPLPIYFTSINKPCLAYSLKSPITVPEDNLNNLDLDKLQKSILFELNKDTETKQNELIKFIKENAFLYKIRFSNELFEEYINLTGLALEEK